jgi:oligopeptidase B
VKLADEAAGRIPGGPEDSVSWQQGGFTFRTRIPAGADDLQLLRSGPGESSERVVLDVNLAAEHTGYADVDMREPSPDGTLLAWSLDTTGAEIYEIRIRDLRTLEDLPEVIPRASGTAYTTSGNLSGVAWCAASEHLFYLVPDELFRAFQVWRHRIGTPPSHDVLVFEESDQRFDLMLSASRSGELAVISSVSRDTTEVRVIPLASPLSDPIVIEPRRRRVEYRSDHARGADGGTLFIVTDDATPEFTLMRASLASARRASWTRVDCEAIAPARADTRLLSCDAFAEHLLLTMRRDGSPLLVITDHDGGNVREVWPSLEAGSIRVEHAEDYDGGSVIIAEESLIDPRAWYRLDLGSAERQLLKRMDVSRYDASAYRTERRAAHAEDGTPIPVTLAYRADTPLDGSAPCLLYGYGAYEDSVDPEFKRTLPSVLDRGVVYAVAHIRGGGECGRKWWLQGRLGAKSTTFTDFIAVADWLAGADGPAVVDGARIVSRGASAGGLLQGAVYSMRPDRWRAVVAEVPFVDCVNAMLDPSVPLTIGEWDEWGDPRKPEEYVWIRSYSPYENIPAGGRPRLLATGALHDPRVDIAEPSKWVARLRATHRDGAATLFRPELGAGAHTGPTGRSARFAYEAEIQAFILDAMGITA